MLVSLSVSAFGQTGFPINGVADERAGAYALINATVYVDYQTRIENAILLIKDGKVVDAGASIEVPSGYQVIDVEGKFIYPAFIDPYTSLGMPKAERSSYSRNPQLQTKKEGPFGWNEAVKAEFKASEAFSPDEKDNAGLRKYGFGAALTFRSDGVVRGAGAFVLTGDGPEQENVLVPDASFHFSFSKGTSRQEYPSSIMGMVSLIRQTYYDAQWYARSGRSEQVNLTLQAFNDASTLPKVFEANGGKLRVLLADKIGDEFGERYIVKGNGDEYQRLDAISRADVSLIIPVDFPDAYDVDDPIAALDVSLEDLKHWELAPKNPDFLSRKGIEFAFTADGLKKKGDYLKNVRRAIEYGLSEEAALKAMTYTPAKYYKAQDEVGSLKKGMLANFIVASGNIFEKGTSIHQTWVNGSKYEYKPLMVFDKAGKYRLTVDGESLDLSIVSESKATIEINDSTSVDVSISFDGTAVTMSYQPEDIEGLVRLSGWTKGDLFKGQGRDPDGNWISWSAQRFENPEEKTEEEKKDDETGEALELGEIIYPFVAYGWSKKPEPETIIFKNATLWTMEDEAKAPMQGDLLIRGGKIVDVGQDLSASGAREVDASGMHITPGIIDEHSHIALSGVNEGSHAVTSEVRMYDAVDSEDIDIYRQLSGGVVAAQLLHGSANPVGGQSALVKFRWGSTPAQMRIENADEYIKFALGENVKQSNWGDANRIRFPQTRMGVEQVYMNAFNEAMIYDQSMKAYNQLNKKEKASTPAPRRDLQLEALAEIINKQRFITCHSYVQSEINMLMKVAASFGFRVNTFTHILEGYKVADKMAEHGVGGSTFSDWWAYKYEVKDAIPYNAALMEQAGVTVAINSDDAEMARRLNQEAAKTIKYGEMDEWEALKMVTINPAKLLHLQDRMGSLTPGKDADIAVWTDHPLSVYAKAQMTLVDGIVYFDAKKDREKREELRKERIRLINKMKDVKKAGGKTQKYTPKDKHRWDCEEFEINENE